MNRSPSIPHEFEEKDQPSTLPSILHVFDLLPSPGDNLNLVTIEGASLAQESKGVQLPRPIENNHIVGEAFGRSVSRSLSPPPLFVDERKDEIWRGVNVRRDLNDPGN